MKVHPGKRLHQLREQLGLTVRDVEAASGRLASTRGNRSYSIPLSRLSDIENKEVIPSIYRIYSLAIIYRRDIREILAWYGIDLDEMAADLAIATLPRTHRIETLNATGAVKMPVLEDLNFDPAKTQNLGRIIQQWGAIPFAFLSQFANVSFTYAYIGNEDLTMSPLLPPGSFIQIDESRDKVVGSAWKSESDRPIYFLETRSGFRCGWCRLEDGQLTLQPHPLSPEPVRIYRYPQEIDVVGEVVGIAMQLRRRNNG
jgi:transcriptional regulator with XRE-family HTH domain